MLDETKKEIVAVSIMWFLIGCIVLYNLIYDFEVYDLIYMTVFIGFYIKYIMIKKKDIDYN